MNRQLITLPLFLSEKATDLLVCHLCNLLRKPQGFRQMTRPIEGTLSEGSVVMKKSHLTDGIRWDFVSLSIVFH